MWNGSAISCPANPAPAILAAEPSSAEPRSAVIYAKGANGSPFATNHDPALLRNPYRAAVGTAAQQRFRPADHPLWLRVSTGNWSKAAVLLPVLTSKRFRTGSTTICGKPCPLAVGKVNPVSGPPRTRLAPHPRLPGGRRPELHLCRLPPLLQWWRRLSGNLAIDGIHRHLVVAVVSRAHDLSVRTMIIRTGGSSPRRPPEGENPAVQRRVFTTSSSWNRSYSSACIVRLIMVF